MHEDQSKEGFLAVEDRFVEVHMTLVRYGGVGMSYSPKSGLKREMYFRGHIEDYERDARFEGKAVRICLETPSGPEWEDKFKTEQRVASACGLFSVRANVQPRKFEEEVGDPALQAFITVTEEAFDAICTHITETLDRIHRARVTLRLVGKSLPETATGSSVIPIRLTDLDVSEDKSYAIGGFEVEGTRTLYPRNRVLPIERRLDERGGASLSILLTDAAYQLDVPTGRVHSVQCHGSVIKAQGKSYEGADATVRLKEFHMVSSLGGLPFDLDPADELPERALVGHFNYWPKDPDKEYSSAASFSFDLKHLPDDTRGLIVPILSQVAGAQVVLTVDLRNEEAELLGATDELEGSVRDYRFSFWARSRLG